MPYIKTYIHFVWSTKNRFPFLDSKELRQKVWSHIKKTHKKKEYLLILLMDIQIIVIAWFHWELTKLSRTQCNS